MCITCHRNNGDPRGFVMHMFTQPATFSSDTPAFPRYDPKKQKKGKKKDPLDLTLGNFCKSK